MKCPDCKAWTEVKETRQKKDGTTYRRYQCANLHRFSTHEAPTQSKHQRSAYAAHQFV
jgi:transcriptional regulator NrdR family protein